MAQQTAWVQIEAQPSLREAEDRARAYAGAFDNVNGFSMGGRWYAIALGPFTQAGAEAELARLKAENLIPQDSFVAYSRGFRQQFWPVGASTLNAAPLPVPQAEAATPQAAPAVALPQPAPDETPREARRSEGLLDREARQLLQTALQWEGFYNSTIDGAFGRGTRAAMADWQAARGYEATGVLTTLQRAELIDAYNAILDGVGLRSVYEQKAGIEMTLPMDMVRFAGYEPPFAQFDPSNGDGPVKVLLISQQGDQTTLFGLYDIMQTLEIVPLDGPRERGSDSFELRGTNSEITSYTYAALNDGMIKGFTLVWPAGDDRRLARVLDEMKASFTPVDDAVLPDLAGDPGEDQRIDLLAGLEIRQPDLTRSGVYLDSAGHVLTTADAIAHCSRITIDTTHEAEVLMSDSALGIAVLKPLEPLAPAGIAAFRQAVPRIQSEVAVSGYPFGGVLGAPTLTFGRLADIRGLNGEPELQRLALLAEPGDAGGPVFDSAGAVLGLLRPRPDETAQRLPDEVNFALSARALEEVLAVHGLTLSASDAARPLDPVDLTALATDVTALVSCWN